MERVSSNPVEVGAWHAGFVAMVIVISARGLQGGIEPANKVRAPALLVLLLILVVYSLSTGDVRRGLTFAFKPDFSAVTAQVVLSAIGQAFYATGVGQAMMIAFGAYVERGTSLVRTSFVITGSILLVSVLATMMIFPLVFGYGMNPRRARRSCSMSCTGVHRNPRRPDHRNPVLSVAGAGRDDTFDCVAGAWGCVADTAPRHGQGPCRLARWHYVVGAWNRDSTFVQPLVGVASTVVHTPVCAQDVLRCVGLRLLQYHDAHWRLVDQRFHWLAPQHGFSRRPNWRRLHRWLASPACGSCDTFVHWPSWRFLSRRWFEAEDSAAGRCATGRAAVQQESECAPLLTRLPSCVSVYGGQSMVRVPRKNRWSGPIAPLLLVAVMAPVRAFDAAAPQLYELTTETGMPHLEENLRYANTTRRHAWRCPNSRLHFQSCVTRRWRLQVGK